MAGTYENADGKRPAGTVRQTKSVPAGSPKAPGRRKSASRQVATAREEEARTQWKWKGGASFGGFRLFPEDVGSNFMTRDASDFFKGQYPFRRNP